MDELKPQTKSGLVNLIFGIYENDVKEVLGALEQIEVLRQGVDKFSVEKIARFFLKEFSTGVSKNGKWTSSLPPEEQKRIKLERRKQLGADLFSVGSDVPFKFPPTFTFVFRAFTSLDGIGKGLDPTYDLTRLAQVGNLHTLLYPLVLLISSHTAHILTNPHIYIIEPLLSLTYSLSHSHTLSLSLSHTHSLPHTLPHTLPHAHTSSLS